MSSLTSPNLVSFRLIKAQPRSHDDTTNAQEGPFGIATGFVENASLPVPDGWSESEKVANQLSALLTAPNRTALQEAVSSVKPGPDQVVGIECPSLPASAKACRAWVIENSEVFTNQDVVAAKLVPQGAAFLPWEQNLMREAGLRPDARNEQQLPPDAVAKRKHRLEEPLLEIQFDGSMTNTIEKVTEENVARRLAIMVGDEVLAAPPIMERAREGRLLLPVRDAGRNDAESIRLGQELAAILVKPKLSGVAIRFRESHD
jgi:hypothetical protein